MGVILCVRPGDGSTIVAISGEVDVCAEAPLRQALLRIIRERSARLMLDLSGVSFMDCAGPEYHGPFRLILLKTNGPDATHGQSVCPPSGPRRTRHRVVLTQSRTTADLFGGCRG